MSLLKQYRTVYITGRTMSELHPHRSCYTPTDKRNLSSSTVECRFSRAQGRTVPWSGRPKVREQAWTVVLKQDMIVQYTVVRQAVV